MRPAGTVAVGQPMYSKMAIDDIPLDQRKYICTMIDFSIHEGNGHWDMLVSELGFTERDSKNFLLAFPKGQSPTENLLRECSYRNFRVSYFLQVLKNVGLVSLAEKVLEELAEKPKPTSSHMTPSNTEMIAPKSSGSDQSLSDCEKIGGLDTIHYSYQEIEKGTNYFAPKMKLGAGAFGKVYKVKLKNTTFACKVLTINNASPHFSIISKHKESDLRNELRYLAEYRHPNIIPLYGWSLDGDDPCLIYQYMKNGSLQDCLQLSRNDPLNWVQRIRIACDAATGLQFLHTIKEKPLIHGDIKTANILLDEAFGAKLGDFGLAREGPRSHVTGSYIKLDDEHTPGTVGYLATEYLRSKMLSVKVDTYAFGVVLLELYTGRMAFSRSKKHDAPVLLRDFMDNIANDSNSDEEADDLLFRNQTQEIPSLPKNIALQFVRLALECSHEKRNKRPSMSDALKRLEGLCVDIEEVMSNSDKDNSGSSSGSINAPIIHDRQSWVTGPHQLSRTPVESVDVSTLPSHRDSNAAANIEQRNKDDYLQERFRQMGLQSAIYPQYRLGVPSMPNQEIDGNFFQQAPNLVNNPLWFPSGVPAIGHLPHPSVPWNMQPNGHQGYPIHHDISMHPIQVPFYQQYNDQNITPVQYSHPHGSSLEPFQVQNSETSPDTKSNHTATTPVTPSTPGNFSAPDSFSSAEYEATLANPPVCRVNSVTFAPTNPFYVSSNMVPPEPSPNLNSNVKYGESSNSSIQKRDALKVNSVKAQLLECLSGAKDDTDVSEIFKQLDSNDHNT